MTPEALIQEKVLIETLPALRHYVDNPSLENLTRLARGLVDSVSVLRDAADSFNIPFDLVWNEVHRSNSTKTNTVISPNVFEVLLQYYTEQKMGTTYMQRGMVT